MGRRGKFGHRRTVLQLDNDKEPSYGFGYRAKPPSSGPANALSGLMCEYGESDEDSDAEEDKNTYHEERTHAPAKIQFVGGKVQENSFPPPPPPTLKADGDAKPASKPHGGDKKMSSQTDIANGHSTKTAGKTDDIDMKVQDFLAEIDAIDVIEGEGEGANNEDINGTPMPPTPPRLTSNEGSGNVSPNDEDDDLKEPEAPTTPWQHCLDEATQCYYYWNTVKNDVQWDIPSEYSQYLLLVNEYEESLAKYKQAKTEQERKKAERVKQATERRRERAKKLTHALQQGKPASAMLEEHSVTDPTGLAVSDVKEELSHETKSCDDSGDVSVTSQPHPAAKDGIQEPVTLTDVTHERTHKEHTHSRHRAKREKDHQPPAPAEPKLCGPQLPIPPEPVADMVCGPHLPTTTDVVCGPQLQPTHDIVYGPQLPVDGIPHGPLLADSEPAEDKPSEDSKTSHSEVISKVGILSEARLMRHRHLAERDSSCEGVGHKVSHKHEGKESAHEDGTSKEAVAEVESDDEEESEEEDFDDLDIIDQQLELALEKKKDELRKLEKEEEEEDTDDDEDTEEEEMVVAHPKKHRLAEDRHKPGDTTEFCHLSKKAKLSVEPDKPAPKMRIDSDDVKLKVGELTEILELSSLVADKLDFLEVTHSGLSRLQLLLLQLETRVEDWRAGALSTDHMLRKLREADDQLTQYESSAAPPHWSCHWDRCYKRYFYCHLTTGKTQWDYPDGAETEPDSTVTLADAGHVSAPGTEGYGRGMKTEAEVIQDGRPEANRTPADDANCPAAVVGPASRVDILASSESSPCHSPPPCPIPHHLSPLIRHPPPPPSFESPAPPPPDYTPPPPPPESSPFAAHSTAPPLPPPSTPPPPGTTPTHLLRSDSPESVDMELDDGELANVIQFGGNTAPLPAALVNPYPVLDRTPNIYAPPKTYTTVLNNPTAPTVLAADPVSLTGDISHAPIVAQEVPETKTVEATVPHASEGHKDKKRKKDKALVAGGLSMKKKKVPSLVEKWQKVQKEVERGASKH